MKFFLTVITLFISMTVWAVKSDPTGLGAVAQNVMVPVSVAYDFVSTGCFVIGASFLFAFIIKYIEHRRSPLMVPISTVIFLLIAGILLILLPLAYKVTDSGIPFSLIR